MKKFLLPLGVVALLSSCYYDKYEDVYIGAGLFTPCDTTSVMSYTTHITPVLQNNCYSCHSGSNVSGGIALDNHAGVAQVAASGQLVGAVYHLNGFTAMPVNLQLDSCSMKQIKKWVDAGAPNN